MESLSETKWDLLIDGTGLRNSLLALALSRSNKKILHVDQNEYYGDAEAAFSLQEVEGWAVKANNGSLRSFRNVIEKKTESSNDNEKLSSSRVYTLTLSPQIIYTRSKLLALLVSSKVYKQLEFQAVGNWWICAGRGEALKRLPNGREDIFQDKSIDNRAKRSLMKFLKFVVDYENQVDIWEPHADIGLARFLSSQFQLPSNIHTIIAALTLSLDPVEKIPVKWALPRIARHLTSIGVFGPGFGAVVPKWGGGAEISQVACRAGAVGGGLYVLGTGVKSAMVITDGEEQLTEVHLSNGEVVRTRYRIGGLDDTILPNSKTVSKVIGVYSSPLASLFKSSVEGAPPAAVSVAVFPPNTVADSMTQPDPVYIMIHSSETGECPAGQCVLYATSLYTTASAEVLLTAIDALGKAVESEGKLIYSIYYEEAERPGSSLDLAFDDQILEEVEEEYNKIMSAGVNKDAIPTFMKFEDRQGMNDDDDEADDGY